MSMCGNKEVKCYLLVIIIIYFAASSNSIEKYDASIPLGGSCNYSTQCIGTEAVCGMDKETCKCTQKFAFHGLRCDDAQVWKSYLQQEQLRFKEPETLSVICQSNHTKSLTDFDLWLSCTLNITFNATSENEILMMTSPPTCKKYGNSLLVNSEREYVISQYVSCVSNRPIFLKMDYENGITKEECLNVLWGRSFTNFFDHNNYMYSMIIDVPTVVENTQAIKYTVFTDESPDGDINILWFISADQSRGAYFGPKSNGKSNVTAIGEIVNIPCVFQFPNRARFLRYTPYCYDNSSEVFGAESEINEDVDCTFIPIDNKSVSYEPTKGFQINTTLFSNWEGKFICKDQIYDLTTKYFTKVTLANVTDFSVSSQLNFNLRHPNWKPPYFFTSSRNEIHNSTSIEDRYESEYAISCTSTTSNLTFVIKYDNETVGHATGVIYTYTDKPKEIYTTKMIISTEKSSPGQRSSFFTKCYDPINSIVVHQWVLNDRRIKPTGYLSNYLHYVGIEVETDTIKCSVTISFVQSLSGLDFKVELRHIKCNSLFSCKELAPATFIPPISDSIIKYGEGSGCRPYQKGMLCKSVQVFNKGYFQCTFSYGSKEQNITDISDTVQDLYFVGFNGKLYIFSTDNQPPIEAIIKMEVVNPTEIVALPGNIVVFCESHSFYFESGIQWLFTHGNGTETWVPAEKITDQSNEQNHMGNWFRISNIYLEDASVKQIMCSAPLVSLNDFMRLAWTNATVNITAEDSSPPTIYSSDDSKVKYFRTGESDQLLKCQADGFPRPEITWSVGGKEVEFPFTVTGGINYKNLQFPMYNDSFQGIYVCSVRNKAGYKNQSFTVNTFVDKNNKRASVGAWIVVSTVLSICILMAIPTVIIIIRRLRLKAKNTLTSNDVKNFLQGNSSDAEKNFALSLAYNEKYELERNEYVIDTKSVLGKGAFGIVYNGTVSNKHYSGKVAFKTVPSGCRVEKLKSLLSELKIMIYLGDHENIIRLIGAYTKEIEKGTAYVATELCSLGSLEQYLRRNKKDSACNEAVKFSTAEQNIAVVSKDGIFPTEKLCTWSSQIANGMKYLAFKHIVHSDLATRNILLDANEIVKITDFGLSRQMYNYYNYVKKGNDPLPWKWMAIESLVNLTFSTETDIWAYGVTLWEIFSLGSVPYPGISWAIEFVEMLENGLRNPNPKFANSKIYSAMLSCWDNNPRERPSFNNLKIFFEKLAKDNVIDEPSDETEDLYKLLE